MDTMTLYKGRGVYGAIGIGRAAIFNKKDETVHRRSCNDVNAEKQRFINARNKAIESLKEVYNKALSEVGEANAQIFDIHIMMAEDDDFNDAIISIIENQGVNAEYAVAVTADNFSDMFSSMEDSYMKARASDVKDVGNRIIRCFSDEKERARLDFESVICAEDLAPSETVSLDKDKIVAIVCAKGSVSSHTAILARNMNIPAVVGAGDAFLKEIKNGDTVVVDGYSGVVCVNPEHEYLEKMQMRQDRDNEQKNLLQNLKGLDNVTSDNRRIDIFSNIGSVDGVGAALLNDSGGIGLFRSEFLYLESNDYPSEEMQFSAYKKVLESMAGKKVVVRTLDIGADKKAPYFNLDDEENPALGYRAIRICLTRPEIFKTQLRALYRASVYGNLAIMFPMITSEEEIRSILLICDEVKEELYKEGVAYSDDIEIGIMIETPAAAIISDRLAPMVDFFSVGTNDLTQYTLACDRQNQNIESFCDPHHEAIMRLIEMSCKNAHENGCWIGICGELAADTSLTKRFIDMGIDELSVSPSYVLKVRKAVREI